MNTYIQHTIYDNSFLLLPERCIYWEQQKALIIADLHFGKTGHFRKSGIAVPQAVFKEDLQRLFALIQYFKPEQLIIAGDMFHSHANKEMDLFAKWRNDIPGLTIQLIKGNHDILHNDYYQNTSITVSDTSLQLNDFCFVHDPEDVSITSHQANYFFTGHMHPGVRISSSSRQSISFPCYYFGKQYAVLPAFSRFTGYAIIQPKKNDIVYGIVNNTLVKIQ